MTELRIADEEACNLAAELAELTGESLRLAVVTALRGEVGGASARRDKNEQSRAVSSPPPPPATGTIGSWPSHATSR
jgi:hypothetical protein